MVEYIHVGFAIIVIAILFFILLVITLVQLRASKKAQDEAREAIKRRSTYQALPNDARSDYWANELKKESNK